jgi:hypothetical protein
MQTDRVKRTYHTSRKDGRFLSTMGFCHNFIETHKPKLAFDPDHPPVDWQEWQSALRSRLRTLMCFPEVKDQPEPVRISSEARSGYRLERWEAYPEPGSVVPFLVLIPDEIDETRPGPGVLCFSGSASSKELLAGEPELDLLQPENKHPKANQMGLHYVRAGMVAIIVENPGTAELDEPPLDGKHVNTGRDKLCGELLMFGRHYLGLSVFQKLHILDWVKELKFVDTERIALSGHSLGTEPAMLMAVLDPGVKALVFNDFLCRNRTRYVTAEKPDSAWHHNNPLWHIVPGMLEWFDFPDLLSAFAPRPLIITEGGAAADLHMLQKVYSLRDAQDAYEFFYYPKYQDESSRLHDFEPIPKGLSIEEWFEYVNVDVPNHCFKSDLAVPFLKKHFDLSN